MFRHVRVQMQPMKCLIAHFLVAVVIVAWARSAFLFTTLYKQIFFPSVDSANQCRFMWIWCETQLKEWSVGFITFVRRGISLSENVPFPIYLYQIRNGCAKISKHVYSLVIRNVYTIKEPDMKALAIIDDKHYSFADTILTARKPIN